MKTQLEKLNAELSQLCGLAETVDLDAESVHRMDMSIADWYRIREILSGALVEASSSYSANEPGRETNDILGFELGEFDSMADLPYNCAALLTQAIEVGKLRDSLSPQEIDTPDFADCERLLKGFQRHVENALHSLFVEGEPTDFEVGTLIIKQPDCTSGDWVGLRLFCNYMDCV